MIVCFGLKPCFLIQGQHPCHWDPLNADLVLHWFISPFIWILCVVASLIMIVAVACLLHRDWSLENQYGSTQMFLLLLVPALIKILKGFFSMRLPAPFWMYLGFIF